MESSLQNGSHGGELISLMVEDERAETLKALSMNLPDIQLTDYQMCDLELLATGAFSPLCGYMIQTDYEAVLDRMQLQNGTLWPIPICLDVNRHQAERLEAGQSIAVRDSEGFLLAVMHLEDIWPIDKTKEATSLYRTTNENHPSVRHLFRNKGEYYLGGKLEVINLPLHYDFKQLRLTPREAKKMHRKLGWKRIVAYQCSKVIHRAQFETTLEAMRVAKGNLMIMANAGISYTEDFDYYTRVRCYKEVTRHYPPENVIISLLPHSIEVTGPREAILSTILAKNYGCTHLVLDLNHGGQDACDEKGIFCDPTDIKAIAEELYQQVGVRIMVFDEMRYLPFEDEFRFAGNVAEGVETIKISEEDIQRRIRTGRRIPQWVSFPGVITELKKAYPPPEKQGFTLFLTGLSGAGKSTIAKVLYSKMLEIGERPVSLLDGDIVRRHLSSELNFSKEHRDINVRRIGFVAMEITKNRGIAICAPIAPYEHTRNEIRAAIEAYGGFIEVHVSTPLQECERRDRKGMYAKARAGLIKGYTGIDDPYETPGSPELRIDTSNITPDEAAQEVILYLRQKSYI